MCIFQFVQINLQYISNTWNVPFKVSESILQKWLDNYKDGKNVAKEFLIRGTDKKNNAVIMVDIVINAIASNFILNLFHIFRSFLNQSWPKLKRYVRMLFIFCIVLK